MAEMSTELAVVDMATGPLMNITNALSETAGAIDIVETRCRNAFQAAMFVMPRIQLQQINQTYVQMERQIEVNTQQQEAGNKTIEEGKEKTDKLLDSVKGLAKEYLTMGNLQKAVDMSDQYARTTAQLSLMNQKFHESGKGLVEMDTLNQAIFLSAQNSRTAYMDTLNAVETLGNHAGGTFDDAYEAINFVEQANKQFIIGGASPEEQSKAMEKLTGAMADGSLKGDTLNSMLEAAPGLGAAIEERMGLASGSIESFAEHGEVSAQVIKDAFLSMADETDAQFAALPMTFDQMMTNLQSKALYAFAPVLQKINEFKNSEQVGAVMDGLAGGLAFAAMAAERVVNIMLTGASFIIDNWSMIGPVIAGIAGILSGYVAGALILYAVEKAGQGIKMASALASLAHAAFTRKAADETAKATVKQNGLNAALLSSPITWILIIIIAVIAAIYAIVGAINHVTGSSISAMGVICGALNVIKAFIVNLILAVVDIFLGMDHMADALGGNIMAAFYNAISFVKALWFGLLSSVLFVIGEICGGLNKLPFVEFDYSGLTEAANEYAVKAEEAKADKMEYASLADAYQEGASTYKAYQEGWSSDAWQSGNSWGAEKEAGMKDAFTFNMPELSKDNDSSEFDSVYTTTGAGTVADNTAAAADNTSAMADSVDITNENLKYLRDIAETEAINRFTTAEIKVEQTNYNNVNSGLDIDGVVTRFTEGMNEAIDQAAEGVHK